MSFLAWKGDGERVREGESYMDRQIDRQIQREIGERERERERQIDRYIDRERESQRDWNKQNYKFYFKGQNCLHLSSEPPATHFFSPPPPPFLPFSSPPPLIYPALCLPRPPLPFPVAPGFPFLLLLLLFHSENILLLGREIKNNFLSLCFLSLS